MREKGIFSNLFRFALLLGLVLVMLLSISCSNSQHRSGQTLDEPSITVEYLQTEYASQLVRDGAELVSGTIELEPAGDGIYTVYIDEKELTETTDTDSYPQGWYLADKNQSLTASMDEYTRTTFLLDDSSIATVMSCEEFVAAYSEDLQEHSDVDDYSQNRLYDVYVMGEQIVLIMGHYI